ncbi:MAG TPA: membrane assembly protein AsmA [Rhodanobacteraceae bacterium]|nr:membrane assembly protein AsmA [Rhodanobacteraceae bacterium]
MSRRLRLSLLIAAGVVAAAALALLLAVYLMLQPARFTDLLRNSARQAGLELTLAAPAEPTLWPQPALVLRGLTLSAQGQPVLVAVRGRLVLPWHTLLGGPPAITRLELDAPRLDLEALRIALAQLPQHAGGAPNMPRIDAGILITDGSLVRGDSVLLDHIRLQTGVLAPGQVFDLQLDAQGPGGQPYAFTLRMTPRLARDMLVFDAVHLAASSPPQSQAQLDGTAQWRGGANLAMSLQGHLSQTPARDYAMAVQLLPASGDTPFVLGLKLDGADLHADLQLQPLQLAAWWSDVAGSGAAGNLPLPPLDGHVEAAKLDFGAVHIEGLQLRAGNALPAAGSAPAPAASSAVAQ